MPGEIDLGPRTEELPACYLDSNYRYGALQGPLAVQDRANGSILMPGPESFECGSAEVLEVPANAETMRIGVFMVPPGDLLIV